MRVNVQHFHEVVIKKWKQVLIKSFEIKKFPWNFSGFEDKGILNVKSVAPSWKWMLEF